MRVSSRVPTMSYLGRFVSGRLHLGGRDELESRYRRESRYSLGSLQLQHGSGLLHSSAEASVDTDILGFLRTETHNYVRIHSQRSTKTCHIACR